MTETGREVWITGVGIVSSLGEGKAAHWEALNAGSVVTDAETYAPYLVHPLAPVDFDKQIPKKGDQRQMEPWQRTGTYAAGLALDDAGVKGHPELLARMDLIVAAGGGERDPTVDKAIMTGLLQTESRAAFLNEHLMRDLRPTLFLAQLSNLLAGNISIVHGVTGSSRTFMGEEAAGVDAVRIAHARIAAGQSEIALVGGACNSDRADVVMLYAVGGYALKAPHASVWDRAARGGGFALGSMGAFLVLEAREHADARGARPLGRLARVLSGRSPRRPRMVSGALEGMLDVLSPTINAAECAVLSGASGAAPATTEEQDLWASNPQLALRGTGTLLGHGVEPQFSMNIALATIGFEHASLFRPIDPQVERSFDGTLRQALVSAVGHWRGEGMALVEAVD
jgi:3-oxoacyl-[acyl-carrier-protein] synthase II